MCSLSVSRCGGLCVPQLHMQGTGAVAHGLRHVGPVGLCQGTRVCWRVSAMATSSRWEPRGPREHPERQ